MVYTITMITSICKIHFDILCVVSFDFYIFAIIREQMLQVYYPSPLLNPAQTKLAAFNIIIRTMWLLPGGESPHFVKSFNNLPSHQTSPQTLVRHFFSIIITIIIHWFDLEFFSCKNLGKTSYSSGFSGRRSRRTRASGDNLREHLEIIFEFLP